MLEADSRLDVFTTVTYRVIRVIMIITFIRVIRVIRVTLTSFSIACRPCGGLSDEAVLEWPVQSSRVISIRVIRAIQRVIIGRMIVMVVPEITLIALEALLGWTLG